jgi:hypothetical protein
MCRKYPISQRTTLHNDAGLPSPPALHNVSRFKALFERRCCHTSTVWRSCRKSLMVGQRWHILSATDTNYFMWYRQELRPTLMSRTVDIYKFEDDGSVRWIGTATDLEDAKATVKILAKSSPGDYLIFKPETGERIVVKLKDCA